MKIKINQHSLEIPEDYSAFEQDDVVSVFSTICDTIDQKKLASFEVFFSKKDARFETLTFEYDFTSIASELLDFEMFLKKKKGEFEIFFYELDRRVFFTIKGGIVSFTIFDALETNLIAKGEIGLENLTEMITSLNNDFYILLKEYFPKALKVFKKESFLIKNNV